MTWIDMLDGWRVIDFIIASFLLAVVIVVVRSYVTVYRQYRALAIAGRVRPHRGLLPKHVVLIGISYLIVLLATMADLFTHFHQPFTWRLPAYLIAYSCGFWAMWDILGYQRHRKYDLDRR